MSILDDARIQQLVRDAEDAVHLLNLTKQQDGDIATVRATLDTVYRDLGKHLHGLMKRHDRIPEPDYVPTEQVTREEPQEGGEERWYTQEVAAAPVRPLFGPGDLGEPEYTEIPESDPLTQETEETHDWVDPTVPRQTVRGLQERRVDPDSPLAALLDETQPPEWRIDLRKYLQLLGMPDDLVAQRTNPEEATTLQWAAQAFDERLGHLPAEIQVAVVGLIAARARNLAIAPTGVGSARQVCATLVQHVGTYDLPQVDGLSASPEPEFGSWDEDVRQFWRLLMPE